MAPKGKDLTFVRLRSKTTGAPFAHPDLRAKLVAEAASRGTNMTDVILGILSKHFNVAYDPGKLRKSTPQADADVLTFGMPPELQRVISAAYPRRAFNSGVLYALHAHFGLRMPPKPRQTRKRRAAAPA